MNEPIWITKGTLLSMHAALLQRFGGAGGLRDEHLVDAALDRPRNRFCYDEPAPDLCCLAASYTESIVGKHPFVDGNKRTGFLAAYTFLGLNGLQFVATEVATVERTLALAARAITEADYAD
ncbi:MAG: type II toxin-antitoxin system death-on-curing family toxin, partial [Puniceicoccaceae bacterium]